MAINKVFILFIEKYSYLNWNKRDDGMRGEDWDRMRISKLFSSMVRPLAAEMAAVGPFKNRITLNREGV